MPAFTVEAKKSDETGWGRISSAEYEPGDDRKAIESRAKARDRAADMLATWSRQPTFAGYIFRLQEEKVWPPRGQ
jgi:hypothetical protein